MIGLLTNIQRFSLDDGPGIRSTVFFCGCNLRCAWCHNPEAICASPQLMYSGALCIGCKRCMSACTTKAHRWSNEEHRIARPLCTNCGQCVVVCPTRALHMSARHYTADEVFDEIKNDMPFYQASGGGVTFSGGEPMLQLDFLRELLQRCARFPIHTAVDTAGAQLWENFETLLRLVDLFLYDIKLATSEKHRQYTQSDHEHILSNLIRLSDRARVWVRVPLIPGIHTSQELAAIAHILREVRVERIELLPYHRYGVGKYKELGEEYTLDCSIPPKSWIEEARRAFAGCRTNVIVNGQPAEMRPN